MQKVLLAIAGSLNAAFILFHINMGWHLAAQAGLPNQGLLETFNAGSAVTLSFLAYCCLFRRKEMLTTALGAAVSTLGAVAYVSRAAEEFVWMNGNWAIAGICLALGLVHAVLALSVRRPAEIA